VRKLLLIFVIKVLLLYNCSTVSTQGAARESYETERGYSYVYKRVDKFLKSAIKSGEPVFVSPNTLIDSIKISNEKKHIDIYFSKHFSYIPFRRGNVELIYEKMRDELGFWLRKYTFTIYSLEKPVEELIPNFYRASIDEYDESRLPIQFTRPKPIVRNIDNPLKPEKGLYNYNIALWHSHGWYYNNKKERWEWQRPRLFQTVEDLLTMSFTIPYLVPMLENAGANVFLPRERDLQINEVIVDNDLEDSNNLYEEISFDSNYVWQTGSPGFASGVLPYSSGVNPFELGSYRYIKSDTIESSIIQWIPDIPETGKYAVYISYSVSANNVDDACYTVYHTGGRAQFLVNQKIGGSTWIYLGTFKFRAGKNPEIGKVVLSNKSKNIDKIVTADAVRFGGGIGVVERGGQTSGRPKFTEGARYYLQYLGMPDTLVYNLNADSNDYKDDYQSRGEWVNYLKGKPYGPNQDRDVKGLGIPIDLSLSIHTDAGITYNDTTVGTLSIYNIMGYDSLTYFPDGVSRFANRDFADILQTQIVEDMQLLYDSSWTRRMLYNADYSEATRPNVPAALVELFSHQNYTDMKLAHDPLFKFHISRAIYKAILKFIATEYKYEYVVQPLPVSHFQIEFVNDGEALLRWKPTIDSLESSAVPDRYIVYVRRDDSGFDNGHLVYANQLIVKNIKPGIIYSFKITAANEGGESFPSEILSLCRLENDNDCVLVINGFDRVSPPESVEADKFIGFACFWDQGVPDKFDVNFTGAQIDYSPFSPFILNDAPGWGASYGDYETKVVPGNSFDFPYIHGKSIREAGYSFVSVSDESVMDSLVDLNQYRYVDLILGEEKETSEPKKDITHFKAFPEKVKLQITDYLSKGGNLFISGAYVGTDLYSKGDSTEVLFAQEVLKFQYITNHAVRNGDVYSVDPDFMTGISQIEFNTDYKSDIYTVEAPDAIEGSCSLGSKTILRYSENQFGAGVAYSGDYKVITFGFPFETIIRQNDRDKVMQAILNYFSKTSGTSDTINVYQ
jgi:hypothetical protein